MNKKMIRRGIAGGVCVVVLAAAGFAVYSKGADKSESQETVQSAEAEKGSISTTVVGTGTLENGTATDVVVPTGVKVKEVLVSSGDTVTEGQVLATLDEASIASELLEVKENIETVEDEIDALSDEADEEGTTEYLEAKVLNGQLADLTEAETALESLLESQAITATCSGTISSVNVQADTEVTKSSESSTSSSASGNSNTNTVASADTTTTTADSTDSTVVKTAAGTDSSASAAAMTAKKSTSTSASVATITTSTGANTGTNTSSGLTYLTASTSTATSANTDTSEDYSIDFLSEDGTAVESIITISECNVEVEAPVTGNAPQTEIAETDQYTGTISWNLSTDKFQSGTSYTADIRLTAKDGYEFSDSILPVVKGADVTSQVVESDAGESILQIKAKFSKTASSEGTSGSAAAGAASSGVSAITGSTGSQSGTSDSSAASGVSGSSGSGSASGTAGSGSTGASGSSSAASSGSDSSGTIGTSDYSLYETAAFSIASATEASVSINVDELDILSVKEGQTATVTLDALDGQEFEGTITEVSNEASSGNSSAKYPVTITFEKTDDMLLGMSASATIHVNEAEDAVLIPVDALQEKGDSTFVYTEKDSDGNLSGEVEVETGISNGSQVEITSGLEEGDTVYYLKAESSDSSSNMPGGMDGQGGMPDMNGGEAPSGGQAPSGGGPSGDGGAPSK